MSHSENYTDTGPTSAFYQGVDAERARIIKLLENPYFHNIQFPDIHIDCEMCKTITLIKGEQK